MWRCIAFAVVALFVVWVPAHAETGDSCFGRPATIVGTDGDDRLIGTDGVDVIVGLGGHDTIMGEQDWETSYLLPDAGDWICGGPGADSISGEGGDDHINGGDGDDDLSGGWHDDVVQGNAGDDVLHDFTEGYTVDADVFRGGPGDDAIHATEGSDRLYGQGGRDWLRDGGCREPDEVYGGPGDDRIESFEDRESGDPCTAYQYVGDVLRGNGGNDIAVVDPKDVTTTIEAVGVAT